MNGIQEYTFSEAAKIFKIRTSDFIKKYIASGRLPFIERGNSKHVTHRDLYEMQESEKVRI